MNKKAFFLASSFVLLLIFSIRQTVPAVEIPLDAITPSRIGYIDLQKVFDIFPEKSFAEGDLLRQIEKRKNTLAQKQTDITALRQQIAADQDTLDHAKAGQAVRVPADSMASIAAQEAISAPTSNTSSSSAVKASTSTPIEPYPTDEESLQGLPGHGTSSSASAIKGLPGLETPAPKPTSYALSSPLLDLMASATGPVLLNAEAISALQKRVDDNRRALDRAIFEFRDYRTKAVEDMKQLQTQKTYDVMSKIYAELQALAQDESVTMVMDKAYVLYGEDTVDLTDKLIARLREAGPGEGGGGSVLP